MANVGLEILKRRSEQVGISYANIGMGQSKEKGFYQQIMSSLYYKIESTWKGYARFFVY